MQFWLLDIILLGFPLAWLWLEKKFRPPVSLEKLAAIFAELGFKKESPKTVAVKTAALTALLLLAAIALGIALNITGTNDTFLVEEKALEIMAVPWVAAYVLLVRVPCEEVFFRGFLLKELGRRGPAAGIIGSSLIFALAHFGYGSAGELIGAFALGGLLAAAYWRSKNLTINILAHISYNFFMFLLILW